MTLLFNVNFVVQAQRQLDFFHVPYDADALPFGKAMHYRITYDGMGVGTSVTVFGYPEVQDGTEVVTAYIRDTLDAVPGVPEGTVLEYRSAFRLSDFLPVRYVERAFDGENVINELTAEIDWDSRVALLTSSANGQTASQRMALWEPITDSVALLGALYSWNPSVDDELFAFLLDEGSVFYRASETETLETPEGAMAARRFIYATSSRSSLVWVTDALPRFVVKIDSEYDFELVRVEELEEFEKSLVTEEGAQQR